MSRGERNSIAESALASLKPSMNGWWRGPCPFCAMEGKTDKKASFGVLVEVGIYKCFRCGVKGKLSEIPDDLREAAPRRAEAQEAMQPPEGYELIADEPARSAACFGQARRYLRSRGITARLAREAGIGVVHSGKYHSRIIVPVRTEDGQWVGWVGRSWVKRADMPYIYPSGDWRGGTLYNDKALHVETDEPLLVVEGVFDALAYWPDASATLGTPSDLQLEELAEAKRPVVAVPDGDAWEQGFSLAQRLRLRGKRAGWLRLPPKVDPDEVDGAWLREEARRCVG